MPDAIFAHPLLARIYDAFEGNRTDLDAYLDLVRELGANTVLDIGCGTGSLSILLTRNGIDAIGVDPAQTSLEVARGKGASDLVTWIQGDAETLPPLQVDLAVMTGNVAQVFLTDDEWMATLRGIHAALTEHGRLIFETRRPDGRAWQEWAVDTGPVVRFVTGVGEVEQRLEVTEIALPCVSFRNFYRFGRDGLVLTSDSTLRFRSREETERGLAIAGFTVIDVRDAPDRPGREYVFVAERTRRVDFRAVCRHPLQRATTSNPSTAPMCPVPFHPRPANTPVTRTTPGGANSADFVSRRSDTPLC